MTVGYHISTILISTLLIIISGFSYGLPKETYSRSREFSAVRMSYDELTSLINKIQSIIKSANISYKKHVGSSEITIEEDDSIKFKFEGEITDKAFLNAPKTASALRYSYRNSGAPISNVTIAFSDWRRVFEVEGESQEQVDALFAMASTKFNLLETFWGGQYKRLFFGLILTIIGIIISTKATHSINMFVGIFFIIFGFLLPYINLLPGTSIYASDASFMVRNAGILYLMGLIIPFFIKIIFGKIRSWFLPTSVK